MLSSILLFNIFLTVVIIAIGIYLNRLVCTPKKIRAKINVVVASMILNVKTAPLHNYPSG